MARLHNHGTKTADFKKDGRTVYRLMSDGKWMKSKGRGQWKMAKFKAEIPLDQIESKLLALGYDKETFA